jgi:hypothetical protein
MPLSAQTSANRYALAWVRGAGAEDCPSATELQRDVEQRIGHRVFDSSAALSIEVSVRRDETNSIPIRRTEIHVRDEQGHAVGERTLASSESDCRSLFSSTALAIALLVDPEATEDRQPAVLGAVQVPRQATIQAAPVAPPAPKTAPFAANHESAVSNAAQVHQVDVSPTGTQEQPPSSAVSERPPGAPTNRRQAQIAASAVGAFSILPRTALGVAIDMRAWELPTVGWSLSALYLPSQPGETRNAASVRVGLFALQPALMLGYATSERWRIAIDLGGSIGSLHYAAIGGSTLGSSESLWLAARAEASLQLMLGNAAFLGLGWAALLPVTRARMTNSDRRSVLYLQPGIGACGRIGLGIRFP